MPAWKDGALDVALVAMPFGPLNIPSLGLALLQSVTVQSGFTCRTHYFTFDFAREIGEVLYSQIADGEPARFDLVGEWIFNSGLFEFEPLEIERYLNEVLRGCSPYHATARNGIFYEQRRDGIAKNIPQAWIDQVLNARSKVAPFLDRCVERILARSPRVVGITSMFQQHVPSLAFAKRLRQACPSIRIIIGGSNCEGPMGRATAIGFPFVDAVVSGEGDHIFPQLVSAAAEGRPFPAIGGVFFPATAERAKPDMTTLPVENLDSLPFPDYEDYFSDLHQSQANLEAVGEPHIVFETARGCWWGQKHHCTFCGLNGSNMAFRSKSPDRALAELKHLAFRYPGHDVSVSDNILDYKYFDSFLPALRDEGLPIKLFYEVKANLKKSDLVLLRDAGVDRIQPGIENFSSRVLQLMRKGVRGIQNVQLLKWCAELGLTPMWGILWGFPGEETDDYSLNTKTCRAIAHLHPPIGITPIRLDRFSPNFANAAQLGFSEIRAYPSYYHVYKLPDALVEDIAYFFSYSYDSPRDFSAEIQQLVQAVAEWRTEYAGSALIMFDQHDALVIADLRTSVPQIHVLRNEYRRIYLFCDAARSFSSIADALGMSKDQVTGAVRELEQANLMYEESGQCVSLAIKAEEYRTSPEVAKKLSTCLDERPPSRVWQSSDLELVSA